MTDGTTIIGAVITALLGLVARYLVPWLKEKLGEQRLADLVYWIGVLVRVAEQMFQDKKGVDKLDWVKDQLAGLGFELDADALRALIEAQVRDMKLEAIVPEPVVVNVGIDAEVEDLTGFA